MIKDIHTHRLDAIDSVISVNPWEYAPRQGQCYSVGVHPWRVQQTVNADFDLLSDIATRDDVVMIGECGIDKLRGGDIKRQIEAVKRHVILSERLGKPLVLHCVRAGGELCSLRRALKPVQPWIVHGFRGNIRVADMLLNAGFFLSFGEKFNPDALCYTPSDRLLIETDESSMGITEIYDRIAEYRCASRLELETLMQSWCCNFLK